MTYSRAALADWLTREGIDPTDVPRDSVTIHPDTRTVTYQRLVRHRDGRQAVHPDGAAVRSEPITVRYRADPPEPTRAP